MAQVFVAFDKDGSGDLGLDEMRELIVTLHPSASNQIIRRAMLEVRKHTDNDDELTEINFVDALVEVEAVVRSAVGEEAYASDHQAVLGTVMKDLDEKTKNKGFIERVASGEVPSPWRLFSSRLGLRRGSSKEREGATDLVAVDVKPMAAVDVPHTSERRPPPAMPAAFPGGDSRKMSEA